MYLLTSTYQVFKFTLECVHKVELEVKGKNNSLENLNKSKFNLQWWIDLERIFHANLQVSFQQPKTNN